MNKFTVLLVDDDERILNYLGERLSEAGFGILTASNGLQALDEARRQEPDMVILDMLMPQMDGLETLRQLRLVSSVPVIFLTARDSHEDCIRGLRRGADDYLAKPFNPDELIARIEAVRRRTPPGSKPVSPNIFTRDELVIDFDTRRATVAGEEVGLTRIEWALLTELAQNLGRFMSYEELLSRVWGQEYRGDMQLLRTWMSRLRGKLKQGQNPKQLIHTIPKGGYIIYPAECDSQPFE
jgi:DNA-binding response OmpR family regulator